MDVLGEATKKMNAAIEHLKHELKGLRTGRANPSALDSVVVEAYGTKVRLLDVASVSVPDARQLVVTPFDASNLHPIKKGIEAANLNLKAMVDGPVVRIKIPEMDTSVRQEMVKQAHKKGEESKISIRNIRRDANEAIKKQKTNGDIPEDLFKKNEKKIQELTDKFCKTADDVVAEKQKEISTI